MPDKNICYSQIKAEALSIYYDFCRDRVGGGQSTHENILAQVDYHFDGTFNSSIEKLMFYVVELVLSGGWHPQIEEYCRTQIAEWLQANDLNAEMSKISSSEAVEFIRDLELLRLLK